MLLPLIIIGLQTAQLGQTIILAPDSPKPATQPTQPSPAAMAVAKRLTPPIAADTLQKATVNIADQLLRTGLAWKGIGCDETDPRCIAAAKAVAARNVPLAMADANDTRQWFYARILQAKMSAAELEAADRFLATGSGSRLATALSILLQPEANSDAYYEALMAAQQRKRAWSLTTASEEFYDATRDLPRSRRTSPAPPQPYSPPKPSPKN